MIRLPKLDVFAKYDWVSPMKQLPRPQPSDAIVNIFNHAEGGVFVDVGAYDGVTCSNTCVLEEGYNWKGLCIEPNPKTFQELVKFRHATLLNVGISDVKEELEFWSISGYAAQLSGFHKFFSEDHVNRILSDIHHHGGEIDKIIIPSLPLQTVLEEQNISKIDYLSIDCECADLKVLKGIDFNKTKISVITTEDQEHKGNNGDILRFLEERDYHFKERICNDLIFIKND
jgi:FkbM family methyltransferase